MLRLNLAREPHWLDLRLGVRVRVEPLTTALMVAARSDPAVRDLPEGTADDAVAIVFAKALAERAILDWEGVGNGDGQPVPVTPEGIAALLDGCPPRRDPAWPVRPFARLLTPGRCPLSGQPTRLQGARCSLSRQKIEVGAPKPSHS